MCNPVLFPSLEEKSSDCIGSCLPEVQEVLKTEGSGRNETMKGILSKINSEVEEERKGFSRWNNFCSKLDEMNAALKGMIVKPNGDLDVTRYFPCIKDKYSLLITEPTELWFRFLKELKLQREQNDCLCKKCKDIVYCTVCLNITKGSKKELKNYYCQLAKLRKKKFLES